MSRYLISAEPAAIVPMSAAGAADSKLHTRASIVFDRVKSRKTAARHRVAARSLGIGILAPPRSQAINGRNSADVIARSSAIQIRA
jgi:hypothetical protein